MRSIVKDKPRHRAQAERFLQLYELPLTERVRLIEDRVKARVFKDMVADMAMSQKGLAELLRIPVATVNRKAMNDDLLSIDESERVLNLFALIGQVQKMVAESDHAEDFDAPKWVAHWIEEPLPALGGKRPAEFLHTASGFIIVSDVLSAMQSGAYL